MSKKIKITDLSKILGLSPTLISMVLNGKGKENKISEATQQKVLETARKLNYTPNQSARALRMGKTFVIGLIVPDISNVFFSRIARHMEDELWKHGYRLVIGSTDENPDNEQRLINLFTTQNVDGIIAASTFQNAAVYNDLKKSGHKIVLFDRGFGDALVPSVIVNNKVGASMAIEKLIAARKKNIGFITLTPSHISPLKDRRSGFMEAMKKHKLPVSEKNICEIKFDQVEDHSQQVLGNWFKQNPTLDAVLVANNTLAFQLMKFIKSASLKQTPAIISFDDHVAFEFSSPQISAIHQPDEKIAEHTIDILMRLLDKKPLKKKEEVIPVSILERESHR